MSIEKNLEPIARPLGHLVIQFTYLEIDLGQLISRLARTDDLIGNSLATLTFSAKVNIIRQIMRQRLDSEQIEKLSTLLRDADKLNQERNRFVHGEFVPMVDANDRHVGTLHRPVRNTGKPFDDITPDEIEDLVVRVSLMASSIRTFSGTMFDRLPGGQQDL